MTPRPHSTDQPATALHIPADHVYWSIIDAPAWQKTGPLLESFLDDALADIPAAEADIHAVAAPCGNGRLLVCAALRSELAALPPTALTLTPDAIPAPLAAQCAPDSLNLLVGAFEPAPTRARRSRFRRTAAVAALALSALATLGFLRRADHWNSLAASADLSAAAVLARTQHPSVLSLDAELARLRRESEAAGAQPPLPDAAARLADLLLAWPADVPTKPLNILVSESGASVNVSIDGDPTDFLRAFRPPSGWTLDQPRVNTAGAITRVALQLKPPREDRP